MIFDMAKLSWEDRRRGIERAVELGFTKQGIAKAIGTNGGNLGNMLTRESGHSKYVEPLDDWLNAHGLVNGTGDIVAAPISIYGRGEVQRGDPAIVIAQKLEAVAAVLRSPDFDRATKIEELSAFAKALYEGLDGYRRAFEEKAKSDA